MKQNDCLDLTKYIMAIMIVAIHTGLFPNILYPWLRIAVPLFFIISSYLFFYRLNNSEENYKKIIFKKYIKRNLQFYLFWFIILLPYTVIARKDWFSSGIVHFFKEFITHLLFSYTFSASWFITGSIWAIIILFSTRKIPAGIIAIILIPVYFFCCVCSSYYFLTKDINTLHNFIISYKSIFTNPANSFPIATFWMFIGKVFAENNKVPKKGLLICILVLSSCFLWFEWRILSFLGGSISSGNDCYVFLIPVCICLFAILKDIDVSLKNAKLLRMFSIIMYPLHASVTGIIRYTLTTFLNIESTWLYFLFVLIICHLATYIIIKLETNPQFRLLKYAH